MTTNETLMRLAESRGYEVFYLPLSENRALTVECDGYHIALAHHLERVAEKEALAHELGHCEYGGVYNRHSPYDIKAKAEYRADKWAFGRIVPVRQLRAAIRRGLATAWELAEVFGVSCQYMQRALDYYKAIGMV